MKRPKVIFCTDGIFPHSIGGMQRHSALLLEAMAAEDRADITVIHSHDKPVLTHLPSVREIVLHTPVEGNYIQHLFRFSNKVYDELQKLDYDVIYSQGFAVLKGINKIGKKVVVNPHGLEPFQGITFSDRLKTLPMRILERRQFKHAAKVVSLGGALSDILRRETGNPSKVVVLPNAVNVTDNPVRNFETEPLQLLFVGRFAFNKGINILMEAARQLNNEGYQKRLVFNLVGKGPLFEQYKKEYNLSNVNFLGFADDDTLMRLYRENDLFVFPTLFEGMPTVVLEGMAVGMPVIVSETGATAELVDSSNGYLIEKNNVRALKVAIQRYCQLNASERAVLSARSREKVLKRFTWPMVAKQHLDLFDQFTS